VVGGAVDGGRGLRADRRRAWRAHAGSCDASQRLSGARVADAGRDGRAADPQDPPGLVFPELPAAAKALRAGAAVGGAAGLCVRGVDQARGPAGGESRVARQPQRGQPDLRGARRAGRGLSQQAVGGPLPLSVSRRQGREGQRRRPRGAQVRGHRPRRARDRPAGDHRAGRRRRRDRGVLDGVHQGPGRARPGRRAAGHLRCPRGAEERDRQGAGCALAALHRALPPRLPRPRPQRPARAAGRADPPDLQRREPSGGARQALRSGRDAGGHAAQGRHHARSGRGGHPGLLRLPGRPLAQDALDQPAGALQPRDRPAHRRRRDLPRRPLTNPPGLDARHRAKRLS
jgi:hypothetical protein